jgi:hypothetical protein
MTTKKLPRDALDEAMFAEIMSASDSEVLAEVGEAAIAKGYSVLERAKQQVARKRFLDAKTSLESERIASARKIVPIDRARAKADFAKVVQSDASLRGKMTLAARKGTSDDMTDDEGLLEDFAELQRDAEKDRNE